jgi:multicomponent Na+:H+ antiporter subunit B
MLLVLMLATAVVIVELSDLFAAALLAGIFSLLAAGVYLLMDAVDVSFTEAAVGAGITTVLFLGALSRSADRERQRRVRWRPLFAVTAVGAALAYGALDLPRYGDPLAPIHHHVAPDYIRGTAEDIHVPNIVTAVLASYRGYDTLGETTVIFTAAIGVLMLLASAGQSGQSEARKSTERGGRTMAEQQILRVMVRLLAPFVLLFAFYVQTHGDFGPGGGFQAGVVFATAFVLYGLVFGSEAAQSVFPAALAERLIAVGVLIYAGTGVVTLLLGGGFLDYDLLSAEHGQHYGILAVEAGVGLAVAATMTRIYYAFATLSRAHREADR